MLSRTFFSFFRHSICFVIVLALMSLARGAWAEDVQLEYNGFDLNGSMELASGKSLKSDGVTLIIHGTLSHGRTDFITDLQQALAFQGGNSLAITLSLGLDQRSGRFDCSLEQNHRHRDGAEEITAWIEWLAGQGVKKISLLGIERGGNQAILYLHQQIEEKKLQDEAERKRKKKRRRRKKKKPLITVYLHLIDRVVLLGPLHLTSEGAYQQFSQQHQSDLGGFLFEAQKHVEALNEQELMENKPFLGCSNARVTAAAFVDYYLPKENYSVLKVISGISLPVLAIFGQDDPVYGHYEEVVAEQLERGEGQLGIVRASRMMRDLTAAPATEVIKQVVGFLRR